MKNLFLSIGVAIILASCGATSSTSSATKKQASITNSYWTLADNVKGRIPTLYIEGDKLSGNGGCNNYFGVVSTNTEGGLFSAKDVRGTRMACDDMSTEINYLDMLRKANRYVVSGDILELYQDNLLLLKFKKSDLGNSHK